MTTTANPLLGYSDDLFRDVVDRDLRQAASRIERDALRTPEVVDRWISVLSSMVNSVEGQLAARKQDFEAVKARSRKQLALAADSDQARKSIEAEFQLEREKYAGQRAKTLRFKVGVDEMLIVARRIRAEARPSEVYADEERARLRQEKIAAEQRVRILEAAIQKHRHEVLVPDDEDDLEPSEADEELWSWITKGTTNG